MIAPPIEQIENLAEDFENENDEDEDVVRISQKGENKLKVELTKLNV